MTFYEKIDTTVEGIAGALWGTPLIILLLGGGIFFSIYSRFTPFLFIKHAIDVLMGKYDSDDDPGQITHFQALSSALASTVGMGNIAGVAVAIQTGGPGAIFWMWLTAVIGMSTKFFTCTLAVMYRGRDDQGEVQGGVMYYIEEGLGKKYRPLALMFSISGLLGCITFFQANQLSQIIRDFFYKPAGLFQTSQFTGDLMSGIVVAVLVGIVIFGGIQRIAKVAEKLVPGMVGLYILGAVFILGKNFEQIPGIFSMIIKDAFTGDAVMGGALGTMIITGVRRGLFSNEAGTGTEAMAHGAAKTTEPVREGLVAMLGPFIDTIMVCTITALIILTSGIWQAGFEGTISSINPKQGTIVINLSQLNDLEPPSPGWLDYKFKSNFSSEKNSKTIPSIEFEIDSVISKDEIIITEHYDKDKKPALAFTDSTVVFSSLKDNTKSLLIVGQSLLYDLNVEGVTMTALAFKRELGRLGEGLIIIAVLTFALSTMFGYSYYGRKCVSHLFGTKWKSVYNWFYVGMIVVASVSSLDIAVNFVDSAFALMIIPTMVSTILLAPRVMREAKRYFSLLK